MVMVDDSHAVGFVGRARARHAGAARRDGPRRHHHRHARQGARRRVRRLHQRPRRRSSTCCASARGPYLFSNTLAPPIVAASLKVLELLESGDELRAPAARQHRALPHPDDRAGLRHPARRPPDRAGHVRRRGASPAAPPRRCSSAAIYVIAFSFPVVPQRPGADPHADVRRALDRGHRPRGRRLRRGQNGNCGRLTGLSGHVARRRRSGLHIRARPHRAWPPATTGASIADEPEALVDRHVLREQNSIAVSGPSVAARSSAASSIGRSRPWPRRRAGDDHAADADDREPVLADLDVGEREPDVRDRAAVVVRSTRVPLLLAPRVGSSPIPNGSSSPSVSASQMPGGSASTCSITPARPRAAGPPAAARRSPGPSVSNASPSRPTCSLWPPSARISTSSRVRGWRSGA